MMNFVWFTFIAISGGGWVSENWIWSVGVFNLSDANGFLLVYCWIKYWCLFVCVCGSACSSAL